MPARGTDKADPGVLWSGQSEDLKSTATGGLTAQRYRLTATTLYFERGALSTSGQQVPVAQIIDVDVKQSMAQRARGLGDLLVHVDRGSGRTETVHVVAVRDHKAVRDLINTTAIAARAALVTERNTQTINYVTGPPPGAPATAPTTAPAGSLVEQLKELAALRDAGILTDEEFATQKARLLA